MPRVELAIAPSDATAAAFRAWGIALSDALAAVGLVRVETPGEIDWTIVGTQNGTPNGVAGFQVWRFNDGLQGTAAVFIKLEFGHSDSGTSGPGQVWATVGTGHNGTGTITGNTSGRQGIGIGTVPPTSPQLLVAGAPNRLVIQWAGTSLGASQWSALLVVERDHQADGGDSPFGVTVAGATTNTVVSATGYYSVVVPFAEATPPAETRWAAPTSTNNPSSHANSVGLGLLIPFYGAARRPALGVGIYRSNDFTPGAVFTIRAYEQDVLYRAIRGFVVGQEPTWQQSVGLAVRID